MTADIRTAAQAEAETRTLYEEARNYRHLFVEGAVWAQARVTPTREQIAERLASIREPEYQGVEDEDLNDADAILALLAELAEGEN